MKNRFIYMYCSIVLLAVVLWGCDNEFVAPTSEPNHFTAVVSEENFANTVQVNGDIDFADLSRGVVTRTWTFPEGVVDIIDAEDDVTSAERKVKAVFLQPGDHEVTLHLEFAGDAWLEDQQVGTVIDTTYTVHVIDSVRSSFTAQEFLFDGSQGAVVGIGNNQSANNKIEAGGSIMFTATSLGEPGEHTWIFPGGDPAEFTPTPQNNGETIEIKYKRLGVYPVTLVSSRARPEGADTLVYQDMIEIIPSTAPVLVDKAYVTADGKIALDFSREIQNPAFEGPNFTVTIENEGRTITPEIGAVTRHNNFNNIVYLELANETLYNSDQVTVDYAQGTLTSSDFYLVDNFSDTEVRPYLVNSFVGTTFDYSFESGDANNWPKSGWGAPFENSDFTFNFSSAVVQAGALSGHMTIDADKGGAISPQGTFNLEGGARYLIDMSLNFVSVGDGSDNIEFHFYSFPTTDWGVPGVSVGAGAPTGEWINRSVVFTAAGSSDASSFVFRAFNPNNSQQVEFYLDNLQLVKLDERP
ncbi:MAG: hypothetical protein RIG77_22255 [Cyclobacteriaceae bacterium]